MKTKLSVIVLLVLALTAPLVGATRAQGPGTQAPPPPSEIPSAPAEPPFPGLEGKPFGPFAAPAGTAAAQQAQNVNLVGQVQRSSQPVTALISTAQNSIQVVVPSTAQWVSTAIRVNIGDPIAITASGSWTPGLPEYDMVDPDGSPQLWPDNFLNLTDIGACAFCATTPTPHWAALIGYIGENPPGPGSYINTEVITEARRIFVVGSNFFTNTVFAGTLWLNFNDDAYSNATWDNAGEVVADAVGGGGGQTYSISGQVRDAAGNPIANVTISASGGGSAVTGADGAYTLAGLAPGQYTLRPSKAGFRFVPEFLNITLTGNRTGQNFQGISTACAVPLAEPFLRFPISDTTRTFDKLIKDTDEGGLISSWFDHEKPTYTANNSITLYTGKAYSRVQTGGPFFGNLYCYDRRCYDGHDGIDIVPPNPKQDPNPPVLAAADGTVVRICASATGCGPLGKQVWINHGNNYATLYAHLKQVNVTVEQRVSAGQPIGIMGSTGESNGTHLHFGLYFNYNLRDPWISPTSKANPDEVVDVFGWKPLQGDPWGTPSVWLWRETAGENRSIGSTGGTLSSPNVTVVFQPGSISGEIIFSLSEAPVAGASAQLRHIGVSFLLRILSVLGGSGSQSLSAASTETLSTPVTITVSYANASLRHLDAEQMAAYHYDEASGSWQRIEATFNPAESTLAFQTTSTGEFSLQAPLLCPAETQEPDDHYLSAETIAASGSIPRLLDIVDDEDWFAFEGKAGQWYTLSTAALGSGVKPVIELYDPDGVSLLASAEGWNSALLWQAQADGRYLVRVAPAGDSAYGCEAAYTLSLQRQHHFYLLYLPLVLRK